MPPETLTEAKPEHNDANIEKLAQSIVDDMDIDTLMGAVKDNLEHAYRVDPELFENEWEIYFE